MTDTPWMTRPMNTPRHPRPMNQALASPADSSRASRETLAVASSHRSHSAGGKNPRARDVAIFGSLPRCVCQRQNPAGIQPGVTRRQAACDQRVIGVGLRASDLQVCSRNRTENRTPSDVTSDASTALRNGSARIPAFSLLKGAAKSLKSRARVTGLLSRTFENSPFSSCEGLAESPRSPASFFRVKASL